MKKERVYSLDFIKIVGTFFIIAHHSGILQNILTRGYIFVEAFFVIAGYLLAAQFYNGKYSEKQYFIKRFKRIYPDYICAFLLIFVCKSIVLKSFPYRTWKNMFAEIFLMQNWYDFGSGINRPMWYLSVSILAELIIYFLMNRVYKRKKDYNWIFFGSIIFFVIYIMLFVSQPYEIENWSVYLGVFYAPFWRGFADLLAGTIIYNVAKKYSCRGKNTYLNVVIVIFSAALVFTLFCHKKVDYISFILILIIVFFCVFCKDSILDKAGKCRLCKWLMNYQYNLYLNHWLVLMCLGIVFPKVFLEKNILIMLVELIIIYIVCFVVAYVQKKCVSLCRKILYQKLLTKKNSR